MCQGEWMGPSQTGVHQGDSCGPIGFALGLEMALDECREQSKDLMWESWYLDDGIIIGSRDAVLQYLHTLHGALLRVGLHLNPSKCKLWGPGADVMSL